jgi:hypothetical protein
LKERGPSKDKKPHIVKPAAGSKTAASTPTEKGFTFRQDAATNGTAWEKTGEFTYVRLP